MSYKNTGTSYRLGIQSGITGPATVDLADPGPGKKVVIDFLWIAGQAAGADGKIIEESVGDITPTVPNNSFLQFGPFSYRTKGAGNKVQLTVTTGTNSAMIAFHIVDA